MKEDDRRKLLRVEETLNARRQRARQIDKDALWPRGGNDTDGAIGDAAPAKVIVRAKAIGDKGRER